MLHALTFKSMMSEHMLFIPSWQYVSIHYYNFLFAIRSTYGNAEKKDKKTINVGPFHCTQRIVIKDEGGRRSVVGGRALV